MPDDLGTRLINAVATQNEAALAECFAPAAEFRALTPPGLRERTGSLEAAALITQWFADSTELQLINSHSAEIEDRLHLSYRFAGVEEGEEYLVEQHLFCTIGDGKIVRADLLCSGFRPRATGMSPEVALPATAPADEHGVVLARLGLLWTLLLIVGFYAGALGSRTGAFAMLTGVCGNIVGHLLTGVSEYRRIMRRQWPKVQPLEDEEDW